MTDIPPPPPALDPTSRSFPGLGEPPSPGSSPPPPRTGMGAPPLLPPPMGRHNSALVFPVAAATKEERAADKARDRNALQRLIASPEMVASCVWLFLMIVLGSAEAGSGAGILILVITATSALFVYLALRSGDAILFSLILAAVGLFTALTVGATFSVGRSSLFWLLPALAIIGFENAISFNFYRRRDGEISRTIPLMLGQNLVAIVFGSIILGLSLRALSDGNGRFSWIWFATVSTTIVAFVIGSLILIRRRALPADRRRFSPGRRMIPPPT